MNLTTKLILLFAAGILLLAGAVLSFWKVRTLQRRVSDAKAERQRLRQLRRKDKPVLPSTKTPPALRRFAIVGILCGLPALGSLGYGGYLIYIHAAPPADYVKTDITIEENGYQNTRFTANGVVYEALPLTPDEFACREIAKPVFTYKTKGLLNGHLTGNYYSVANSGDFDLIWDGLGCLYAPAEQYNAVLSYYRTEALAWTYLDFDAARWNEDPVEVSLSGDITAALQAYLSLDTDSLEQTTAVLEEYDTAAFEAVSSDGIISHSIWFVVADGTVYLHTDSATTEDDREEFTLSALPDEIGGPILEMMNDR